MAAGPAAAAVRVVENQETSISLTKPPPRAPPSCFGRSLSSTSCGKCRDYCWLQGNVSRPRGLSSPLDLRIYFHLFFLLPLYPRVMCVFLLAGGLRSSGGVWSSIMLTRAITASRLIYIFLSFYLAFFFLTCFFTSSWWYHRRRR